MNMMPLIKDISGSNREVVQKMFEHSQQTMQEIISSAKSKTLEELYTDEFRPQILNNNQTTVKSLKTGKTVIANLYYILTEGKLKGNHRRKYFLKNEENGKKLGFKSFGLDISDKNHPVLTSGYVKSYDNDKYTGTQIRLLQVACEFAKKHGIDKIPLISLFPALRFHAMMGFRPLEEKSLKINSKKDINNALQMYNEMYRKFFYEGDVIPVFSKIDGEIYFDRNKTTFCTVMTKNEEKLKSQNKRHLDLSNRYLDYDIPMSLEGEEFKKWQERLKGFEILPEKDSSPKKATFIEKIQHQLALFE